jgi:hypothetical protein
MSVKHITLDCIYWRKETDRILRFRRHWQGLTVVTKIPNIFILNIITLL